MKQHGTEAYLFLILLAFVWGSAFMFIELAIETIPPIWVATGRILIASVMLLIFVTLRGRSFPRDTHNWIRLALIGILGGALPFFLISYGQQRVDSGVAAIFLAIVPVATFLLAHFSTHDEKLTPQKLIGILLSFSGILVLFGGLSLSEMGLDLTYKICIIAGAICYALSSLAARQLRNISADMASATSLSIASILLILLNLFLGLPDHTAVSPTSFLAVLVLGVVPTAMGTMIMFRLIKLAGIGFMSLNNYFVPLVAIALGAPLLDEPVTSSLIISLALILGGVYLVTAGPYSRHNFLRKKRNLDR